MKNIFVIVLATMICLSCKYSTTYMKEPIFTKDLKVISDTVASLINAQRVKLHGSVIKSNGKPDFSELRINIINPQNFSDNDILLKQLGMKIAMIFKRALKDANEYDNYKVLYEESDSNDQVATTQHKSFNYRKEELR